MGDTISYNPELLGQISGAFTKFDAVYEEAKSETEIGLNSLLISPCNIGKVFNLDSITLIESLHRAEKTGLVKIVRTAGLDYIKLKEGYSFIDCVIKYYEEIVQ